MQPSLLLFHGLLSSPQEFGLITFRLKKHGINHELVKVPSYTMAIDERSYDWKIWQKNAVEVVDEAGGSDRPVVLGGLCMGGVLAAAAAMQTKRKVAGLILMSPTFEYNSWGLSPIRHLRHLGYWTGLDRFFSVHEREPYGVKSPKIRKWICSEMAARSSSAVGPARIPLSALREGERLMAEVRQNLGSLNIPLLIIHAREDEITNLQSVQKLFKSLPLSNKRLSVLENSYHMITIDNDRHEVAKLIEDFVKQLSTKCNE